MIDNQTGYDLVALFSGVVLFFCLYMLSLLATSSYKYSPNPFNAFALLRECIGMVVRRLRKLPRVPEVLDAVRLFNLNPGIATAADVDEAAQALFGQLFASHFWAYPTSQRRLLQHHMKAARGRIAFEAEIDRMASTEAVRERQRAERAQAHRAAQQSTATGHPQARRSTAAPAPRPATGWRRVLGLQSVETDAAVIKKAYRKRVSAAHPDRGGSTENTAELNEAFAEAREELAFV